MILLRNGLKSIEKAPKKLSVFLVLSAREKQEPSPNVNIVAICLQLKKPSIEGNFKNKFMII